MREEYADVIRAHNHRVGDIYARIVRAIEAKAEALCPDSLALIGVYGSCATGDVHPCSDLDLLILIRDERGRCLTDTFILEDVDGETIGFDLYATTWESLESDAACPHANLAKLMDAEILCVKEEGAARRLEDLRSRAAAALRSEERFSKAAGLLAQAKEALAEVFLSDDLCEARVHAADVFYYGLNGLMLFHGRYYRRGVKRTFEEMADLPLGFDIRALTLEAVRAETSADLRARLTEWVRAVGASMTLPTEKAKPDKGNLAGTYEEMFSNWRNKMAEAEERDDLFASFINLASLEMMLREIAAFTDIPRPSAMADFTPRDLCGNTQAFDRALEAYGQEYARVGLEPRRFADAEAFLEAYLKEV